MSGLLDLKDWYTLGDAAKRISKTIGEQISLDDLIQFIIEGRVSLSWYARHVPARRVALFTTIFGPGFVRMSLNKERDEIRRAITDWHPIDEPERRKYLDGLFRLELDSCGALKDWVHSLMTGTGGELLSLDGYFVSDDEGTMWQIQERCEGWSWTDNNGVLQKVEPFYYPTNKFPEVSELVIQRRDIEQFEFESTKQLTHSPNNRSRETEIDFVINGYLDETENKGGAPGLWRYLVTEMGATFVRGEKYKWQDPTGKAHTKSKSRLENRLSELKRLRGK